MPRAGRRGPTRADVLGAVALLGGAWRPAGGRAARVRGAARHALRLRFGRSGLRAAPAPFVDDDDDAGVKAAALRAGELPDRGRRDSTCGRRAGHHRRGAQALAVVDGRQGLHRLGDPDVGERLGEGHRDGVETQAARVRAFSVRRLRRAHGRRRASLKVQQLQRLRGAQGLFIQTRGRLGGRDGSEPRRREPPRDGLPVFVGRAPRRPDGLPEGAAAGRRGEVSDAREPAAGRRGQSALGRATRKRATLGAETRRRLLHEAGGGPEKGTGDPLLLAAPRRDAGRLRHARRLPRLRRAEMGRQPLGLEQTHAVRVFAFRLEGRQGRGLAKGRRRRLHDGAGRRRDPLERNRGRGDDGRRAGAEPALHPELVPRPRLRRAAPRPLFRRIHRRRQRGESVPRRRRLGVVKEDCVS
mmetsp:Transcript_14649/g.43671  ORF Transcript_14649/g.43671 Transcript_14649/m.43671 type:complete len:413 (-) Transcript_14649:4-1242(-)